MREKVHIDEHVVKSYQKQLRREQKLIAQHDELMRKYDESKDEFLKQQIDQIAFEIKEEEDEINKFARMLVEKLLGL